MKRSIRILHVVGGMNTGGIETWLMHVLRGIDKDLYQIDFLTHTSSTCFYDKEIRLLGCQIFSCPKTKKPLRYAWNLNHILKNNGPYDVVHSHVAHFNGVVLTLARLAGVPLRIAHSHSNASLKDRNAHLLRKLYLRVAQLFIRKNSTARYACSNDAGLYLFGQDWGGNQNEQILSCGFDLTSFSSPVDRSQVLEELGISEDCLVVGHVGRFVEAKNHTFIVDIFYALLQRNPLVRLLLVGDGLLRTNIEEKVEKMNLVNYVIFSGVRTDISRMMLGAIDILLFPSLSEGLGLVLIEAQAAGVPCVVSEVIPPEAFVVPDMINVVNLKESSQQWAYIIQQQLETNRQFDYSLEILLNSHFNVMKTIRSLEVMYSSTSKDD